MQWSTLSEPRSKTGRSATRSAHRPACSAAVAGSRLATNIGKNPAPDCGNMDE